MRGRAIAYDVEELAWLEERRDWPRGALHQAFVVLFNRDDVSRDALKALMNRKGWTTGRTGHFEPGQEPLNKGRACPPGTGGRHPNSRRTQFKKGQRPHTYRGPGHESICPKDGYVILVVAERNPWSGAETRPVHKHRYLWEKQHGPIPKGHCLKCLDGNKANTDPSNWQLIPRGVLARLNGGRHKKRLAYDAAAPELKPVLMAMAKVEHRSHELQAKARKPLVAKVRR